MKRIIFYLVICMSINVFCMDDDGEKVNETNISIAYSPSIPEMQQELFNVRFTKESERELLFEKAAASFPLSKAIERIAQMKNPQVILWFAGYFGSVTKKNVAWYKDNIFKKLPNASFWLTDLNAWSFLSVDSVQLQKNNPDLVGELSGKGGLSEEQCPLINQASSVVDKDLENETKFKVLSAQSFFKRLLSYRDESILTDEVCNNLCRDEIRADALPCSLSQLGYRPSLLNRTIKRFQSKEKQNGLEVNFSLIYPVLQYLEGAYYACEVIREQSKSNPEQQECSVVFLLPNKEFTYFLVPGEKESFESFKTTVEKLVDTPRDNPVSIDFEPFSYGEDFYDAPYRLGGTRYKKNALIDALKQD